VDLTVDNLAVDQRTRRTYRSIPRTPGGRHSEVEAEAEGDRWAEAAEDLEFKAEVLDVARQFDDAEAWPVA
jgi:hypothetical protein